MDWAAFLSLEPLGRKQRVPPQLICLLSPRLFEGKLCLEMVAKEMHLLDTEFLPRF